MNPQGVEIKCGDGICSQPWENTKESAYYCPTDCINVSWWDSFLKKVGVIGLIVMIGFIVFIILRFVKR